jgi:hypothetical protein
MRRIYLLLAALIGISAIATAQSNLGSLAGKVNDETTKKPIEFALVTIEGGGGIKKSKYIKVLVKILKIKFIKARIKEISVNLFQFE